MEEKEQVAPEVVDEPKSKYDGYVMKLPESEEEQTRYVEPNSPAHWSMRLAAGIIDLCILLAACFGLIQLFIVTPMGDGHVAAVVRTGHHLGQYARVQDPYDSFFPGVDNCESRRFLGVLVIRAPVIGHPEIAALMRKTTFDRLTSENVGVLMAFQEREIHSVFCP